MQNNIERGCRNFDSEALRQEEDNNSHKGEWAEMGWIPEGFLPPKQALYCSCEAGSDGDCDIHGPMPRNRMTWRNGTWVEEKINWKATIHGWLDIGIPILLIGLIWRGLWVILVKGWRPVEWMGGGDSPWMGPLCWGLVGSLGMMGAWGLVGLVEWWRERKGEGK